ncbi:MAG: hypothetical protein ACI3XM_09695 [Eubacteriales bacterium]
MKHKSSETNPPAQQKQNTHVPPPSPSSFIRFNRFNRLLWPLVVTPLFTLLYYPVNRYVMLPKLGSGKPYVDMSGVLVESYFSANTMALFLFWLLLAATEFLLIRSSGAVHGWKRVLLLLFCTLMNIVTGFFFLEFTVWG